MKFPSRTIEKFANRQAEIGRKSNGQAWCVAGIPSRKLISPKPQPHGCDPDFGQQDGDELVVPSGDMTGALQPREQPFDQVALAVASRAEAQLPMPVALER